MNGSLNFYGSSSYINFAGLRVKLCKKEQTITLSNPGSADGNTEFTD
jgi:hypothetical protein